MCTSFALVLICIFHVFVNLRSTQMYKIERNEDAWNYLDRLGYIDHKPVFGNRNTLTNEKETSVVGRSYNYNKFYYEALKNYQLFYGILPTGVLDKGTKVMMNRPRCGNMDPTILVGTPRRKRFSFSPFKWEKQVITYRVMDYPDENLAEILPKTLVDSELRFAFDLWSPAVNLSFVKVDEGTADIEIRFAVRSHGDGIDFEGPGLMLAHAYYPDPESPFKGDIHYDSDEPWTIGIPTNQEFHLRWITIHEIGHSLGLEHSYVKDAYMFAMYPLVPYDPKKPLNIDDVQGAQALYQLAFQPKINSEYDSLRFVSNKRLRSNIRDFTRGRDPRFVKNPISKNRRMICKLNEAISSSLPSFWNSIHICIPTEYFQ